MYIICTYVCSTKSLLYCLQDCVCFLLIICLASNLSIVSNELSSLYMQYSTSVHMYMQYSTSVHMYMQYSMSVHMYMQYSTSVHMYMQYSVYLVKCLVYINN